MAGKVFASQPTFNGQKVVLDNDPRLSVSGYNAAQVLLNFGNTTGVEDTITSTTVPATWVTATSTIICQPSATTTTDHEAFDAAVEGIWAYAANLVPGVSFDIIGIAPQGTWGRYYFNAVQIAQASPGTTPTLAAHYEVYSGGTNTNALTTTAFTPAANEVIIVKLTTYSTSTAAGTPSGGGLTYTQRVTAAPGGFNGYASIWTAVVGATPASMSITATPAGACQHQMIVERWTGAKLATTPAVNSVLTGSGAPAASITTGVTGAVLSWCSVDENSRDPTGHTYLLSAVEDGFFDGHLTTDSVAYHAYAPVTAAGSYTVGMSTPSTQQWVLAGIEIQPA